jgi:hypothetical protein
MTLTNKKIATYLCYLTVGLVVGFQIIALEHHSNRVLYLLLSTIAIASLVYEFEVMGCTPNNCTLDRNRETVEKALKTESFACQEANRVNWRRAFLLAFIPFLFLNSFQSTTFEMNILTFLITLFILYFYFNFDAYHRADLACKASMHK